MRYRLSLVVAFLSLSVLACALTTVTPEPTVFLDVTDVPTIAVELTAPPTRTPIGNAPIPTVLNNTNNNINATPIVQLPACAPRADWAFNYTVVAGDTLFNIATRAQSSVAELTRGNCLEDANRIEVGQVLRTPNEVRRDILLTIESESRITLDNSGGFSVTGTGRNLPANRVTVDVLDTDGNRLDRAETTLAMNDNREGTYFVYRIPPFGDDFFASGGEVQGALLAQAYDNSGQVVATASQNVTFVRQTPTQIFITIEDLIVDNLAIGRFTVHGSGAGLFEGNIVVQVQDQFGNVKLEEPTTLRAPDIGLEGPWEHTFELGELQNGDFARVYAYSTSPRDGSVVASFTYDVETIMPDVQVDFSGVPTWSRILTPSRSGRISLRGTVEGLPDGVSVVSVELLDSAGNSTGNIANTPIEASVTDIAQWSEVSFQLTPEIRGNYRLRAMVRDPDNNEILAQETIEVVIAENPNNMTALHQGEGFTFNYPAGWVLTTDNDTGLARLTSFPLDDYPPGAGWTRYTVEMTFETTPYAEADSYDALADTYAAEVLDSAVNPNLEDELVELPNSLSARRLMHTGGTGKRIVMYFIDTGSTYLTVSVYGNHDDYGEAIVNTIAAST